MRAVYQTGRIKIYDAYLYREAIKVIPGHRWDPAEKAWLVPFNLESAMTLQAVGCRFDGMLREMASKLFQIMDSKSVKVEPVPAEPMPVKIEPYKHQVEAYSFVCALTGLFKKAGDAA